MPRRSPPQQNAAARRMLLDNWLGRCGCRASPWILVHGAARDMRPLYLIDAYNFLHAVVLKGRERANWWSGENQARVVSAVAALGAGRAGFEACIVFDRRGAAADDDTSGGAPVEVVPGIEVRGIQVHWAPDADDYIVARCAELSGSRELWVVSADRSLGDRARRHGARRVSPWAFASGEPSCTRAPAKG